MQQQQYFNIKKIFLKNIPFLHIHSLQFSKIKTNKNRKLERRGNEKLPSLLQKWLFYRN